MRAQPAFIEAHFASALTLPISACSSASREPGVASILDNSSLSKCGESGTELLNETNIAAIIAPGTNPRALEIAKFGVDAVVLCMLFLCNSLFCIVLRDILYEDAKSPIFLESAFVQFFFDIQMLNN